VEGQEEVAVRVRREILVERHRLGDGRIVLDGATLKEVHGGRGSRVAQKKKFRFRTVENEDLRGCAVFEAAAKDGKECGGGCFRVVSEFEPEIGVATALEENSIGLALSFRRWRGKSGCVGAD
jgi:hypothetical protein